MRWSHAAVDDEDIVLTLVKSRVQALDPTVNIRTFSTLLAAFVVVNAERRGLRAVLVFVVYP